MTMIFMAGASVVRGRRARANRTAAAVAARAAHARDDRGRRGVRRGRQLAARRMDEKARLRAQLDAASAAAPVPLPAGVADWTAWRFRPVVVTGTFDAARQILIDNKVHAGRRRLCRRDAARRSPTAASVLVDRGFVAGGASRRVLPAVPPAGGTGHGARTRQRSRRPATSSSATRRPTVRCGSISIRDASPTRPGLAVLPIVIEATAPTGGDEALVPRLAAPDVGIERHWIYMLQWYSFAALAVVLWLWFWLQARACVAAKAPRRAPVRDAPPTRRSRKTRRTLLLILPSASRR